MDSDIKAMTVTVTVDVDGTSITRTTRHAVGGRAHLPLPTSAAAAVEAAGEDIAAALTGLTGQTA